MNVSSFLSRLRLLPSYDGQMVHVENLPEQKAIYAKLDAPLPEELAQALAAQGMSRFYQHQAEAIDLVRCGLNVIITTPTASGKSLCYNAPVLETMLLEPEARAVYLFPTKALAQDQYQKIVGLGLGSDITVATYDGDTPKEERGWVKKYARLIITNPDMLHVGILPYHTTWGSFFRGLRYIIVDEAHVYRGVFGAHVANILRRLLRMATIYGATPQIIACSATIANPEELFSKLTGRECEVVDGTGAPRGRKQFIFWNPPVFDKQSGARKSTNGEATQVFTTLIQENVRTICFTRARKQAELMLNYTRNALESTSEPELAKKVLSYRAGYTAEQRRSIEKQLFDGELTGVTSTNALELGVDIGGIDACIMTGYPGTVASTWQQAGRAGRREGDSLAVLVAASNPLDQFLMRQPEYFFGQSHEHAALDPTNKHILAGHLLCAAYERPLDETELDTIFGGERARWVANHLIEDGMLAWRNDRMVYAGAEYPAGQLNIRSAGGENYTIFFQGKVLGTVESSKAFETLHPGAVYLHLGESYVVEELDVTNKKAVVRQAQASYYTEPRTDSIIEIVTTHTSKEFGNTVAYFGEVKVTTQVVGFKQKQLYSDEVLGNFDLDLPEQIFTTEAVWYPVSNEIAATLAEKNLGHCRRRSRPRTRRD